MHVLDEYIPAEWEFTLTSVCTALIKYRAVNESLYLIQSNHSTVALELGICNPDHSRPELVNLILIVKFRMSSSSGLQHIRTFAREVA
ncbi:MAG: hypothetical protein L7S67_05920 [Flavobacteriales bacterium]|nr:hypothetical protein [Flavobacteriales bacterium]